MLRWFLIAILAAGITMAVIIAPQMLSKPANKATDDLKFPTKTAEQSGPSPVATVDHEPSHSFEPMPQNSEGKHKWKITNTGKLDLELTKGPSTCSCTIANFVNDESKFILKPGESTEIELKWETRLNNGEFKKSASVLTNDPLKPSVEFVVQGIVRPAVMVQPQDHVLNFSNVSNDNPNEALVAVYSSDKTDLKILNITNTKPEFITSKISPLSAEEKNRLSQKETIYGQKVVVTLKPGMPVGLFSEEMIIKTDHPRQEDLKIMVTGKMTGPITCFPEVLRLSQISGEKGGQMQATLIVRDKKSVKFEVAVEPKPVKVTIVPADDSKGGESTGRYRLTLSIPPGSKPGALDAVVVLKTDHPLVKEIKIPVTAVILGTK
ncbi:MAG: DUF1573 domain-containing protein [Planctomycetota bacterium]|nr:DUF1573 domain-containing protein [Planctomycetota bacterium]